MAKKVVPVYADWGQVDEALKMISKIDQTVAIHEAKMNEDIDSIKARVQSILTPLLQERETLEKNIKEFTESRMDEFKESKSKKFTFGTVGFRKSTEIITRNVKAIIGALKNNKMYDCIIVKETINKDELAKFDDAAIEKVGAKRKIDDKFYFEIDKERVEG